MLAELAKWCLSIYALLAQYSYFQAYEVGREFSIQVILSQKDYVCKEYETFCLTWITYDFLDSFISYFMVVLCLVEIISIILLLTGNLLGPKILIGLHFYQTFIAHNQSFHTDDKLKFQLIHLQLMNATICGGCIIYLLKVNTDQNRKKRQLERERQKEQEQKEHMHHSQGKTELKVKEAKKNK